jgi:hypothetical protein
VARPTKTLQEHLRDGTFHADPATAREKEADHLASALHLARAAEQEKKA